MITTEKLTKRVLKYKINAFLAELTEESRVKVKNKVMEKHGFNKITMSRYLNILMGDRLDIPSDVLRTFADLLNKPMEQLFNDEKKSK